MVHSATKYYNFLILVFVQLYSITSPSLLLAEAIDDKKKKNNGRAQRLPTILFPAFSQWPAVAHNRPTRATALPIDCFILEFR